MNGMVRSLAIFGIGVGVGTQILNDAETPAHVWRGKKLQEASIQAGATYRSNLNDGLIKQVHKRTTEIIGDDPQKILNPVVHVLHFLNCGLLDLHIRADKSRRKILDVMLKRVVWTTRLYDTRLDKFKDHEAGFALYDNWGK